MSRSAAMLQSIMGLAENLQALNQEAVREYTPIVDAILCARNRDASHIEHTLDGLLDFCGYEPALQLYKKLCRHYFTLDPVATAYYVHAYREMWDTEAGTNRQVNSMECGGSTPLFGRPPRRTHSKRVPAKEALA